MSGSISDRFLRIEYDLMGKLNGMSFGFPVEYVYNPLEYARECHVDFVRRYYDMSNGEILFLGMNPGPWGMCQNGIPFGDTRTVNHWFTTRGRIGHPEREHEKVKVKGFECGRREGSGERFWGFMKNICATPEIFFRNCLVYNYCPLAFLKKSGANVTPQEIEGGNKELYKLCDAALSQILTEIGVKIVFGIGRFAEDKAKRVLKQMNKEDIQVFYLPHPSSRTKIATEEWMKKAEEVLRVSGAYDIVTKKYEQ